METPRYITQISSEWLNRVTQAANLKPGPGIKLTPDNDGIKIEIDQEVFKQWFWAYVKANTISATNTITLADTADVVLDPGA